MVLDLATWSWSSQAGNRGFVGTNSVALSSLLLAEVLAGDGDFLGLFTLRGGWLLHRPLSSTVPTMKTVSRS